MDSKRKESLKAEIINLIIHRAMHIDFTPPTNGTYNNSGSSRRLANYLEHEDLERMEKESIPKAFQSDRR